MPKKETTTNEGGGTHTFVDAPTYWTREERSSWGHLTEVAYEWRECKVMVPEMRRILATVEALEKQLEAYHDTAQDHGGNHTCSPHCTARALLAALAEGTEEAPASDRPVEGKPEAKGPSGDPGGVA